MTATSYHPKVKPVQHHCAIYLFIYFAQGFFSTKHIQRYN